MGLHDAEVIQRLGKETFVYIRRILVDWFTQEMFDLDQQIVLSRLVSIFRGRSVCLRSDGKRSEQMLERIKVKEKVLKVIVLLGEAKEEAIVVFHTDPDKQTMNGRNLTNICSPNLKMPNLETVVIDAKNMLDLETLPKWFGSLLSTRIVEICVKNGDDMTTSAQYPRAWQIAL